MNIELKLVVVASTLLCLGCVGKYIAALGPPRTVIFRDTTTSLRKINGPPTTVQFVVLKDEREGQENVGKVYNNVGEHVKDLKIHDGRSLKETISFILADSLTRAGYNAVVTRVIDNQHADFDVVGVITSFEIIEKTTRLIPTSKISRDEKFPQYSYQADKHSRGRAFIELTIHNNRSGKLIYKTIEVASESDGITAQEMASIMMEKIVNKMNSIMFEVLNS